MYIYQDDSYLKAFSVPYNPIQVSCELKLDSLPITQYLSPDDLLLIKFKNSAMLNSRVKIVLSKLPETMATLKRYGYDSDISTAGDIKTDTVTSVI